MATRKNAFAGWFFVLGLGLASLHHGWTNYDQSKVLDFSGTIQKATYENPHVTAQVKAEDTTWTVVLAPVSRMQSRGVRAAVLEQGTAIRVVGYPHKQVPDEMRAERIFLDDKKYELR